MFSEIFTSLVLFEILLNYSCSTSFTKWSQNHGLVNVRQTTNIGLLRTSSVIACASHCINSLPCMSFSYNSGNGTCLLYAIPFTVVTTRAVSENGWQSYNLLCGNDPIGLDYFYKRSLNLCYHLETDDVKKNVTEAIDFCSAGGRLLRIDTIEKQAHMVEFLVSLSKDSLYIGGLSEHRDDLFLYEDGTPLSFFLWSPDSPKGRYAIRLKSEYNFKWANNQGRKSTPFLCEKVL